MLVRKNAEIKILQEALAKTGEIAWWKYIKILHLYFSFSLTYTVCPGSSDPNKGLNRNYFIQLSSSDRKLFCSVNEKYSTLSIVIVKMV